MGGGKTGKREQESTMSQQGESMGTAVQLRKRVGEELSPEAKSRWEKRFGRPRGYWKVSECAMALANPHGPADDVDAAPVQQVEHAPPHPMRSDVHPMGEDSGNGHGGLVTELHKFIAKVASESINEDRVRELIAEASAGNVSEETVRGMVSDAVKDLRPSHFIVQIGDAEPKKIEGQAHHVFEFVLKLVSSKTRTGMRRNVFLVGPAGSGKSTLGYQIADALGLRYGHLSLTAGISEVHFTGRYVPAGENGRFVYVPSQFVDFYKNGGVFVLEEMDSADANVLLAVNNALPNGQMATNNPDEPVVKRHPDFVCLACANTFGTGGNRVYAGRNQLDGATLDRFATATVELDYDSNLETQLVANKDLLEWAHQVRAKVVELNMRRWVSTRWLVDMDDQIAGGVRNVAEAKASLFVGWTKDEVAKMGTLA